MLTPESLWPCSTEQLDITLLRITRAEFEMEFVLARAHHWWSWQSMAPTTKEWRDAKIKVKRGVMDHPKQILHGDWHPKNLRMRADGRVASILDFDAVRVDAVAHELANGAASFTATTRPCTLPMAVRASFQSRATFYFGVAITHGKALRWHGACCQVDDRDRYRGAPCCPLPYGRSAASMFMTGLRLVGLAEWIRERLSVGKSLTPTH